ncbi:hypothetical protein ACHAWF_013789 [Thalassiosira exigua]
MEERRPNRFAPSDFFRPLSSGHHGRTPSYDDVISRCRRSEFCSRRRLIGGNGNVRLDDRHPPRSILRSSSAPPFSTYGCGSTLALVRAAVEKAANATSELGWPDLDFVLFTGDHSRHKVLYREQILEDIRVVTDVFEEYFPDTPLVKMPALDLGNHDLERKYALDVTSHEPCLPSNSGGVETLPVATNEWLQHLSEQQSDLFVDELEKATFACGGYMNRAINEELNIISLNTVVWSYRHKPHPKSTKLRADPFGQFAWLRTQLSDARDAGKKVFLTGHIPPVVDGFDKLKRHEMKMRPFYEQDKPIILYDIIAEYMDVLAGLVFGHTHSNELRHVAALSDNGPPLLIGRSVGPCFSTNPGFNVVKYDRGGMFHPTDIASFTMDLSKQDSGTDPRSVPNPFVLDIPSVVEYLGMDSLTNSETLRLANRMLPGSGDATDVWDRYYNNWFKGVPQNCHSQTIASTTCQRYQACIVACSDNYGALINCNASVAAGMGIEEGCGLDLTLDEYLAGETEAHNKATDWMRRFVLVAGAIGMIYALTVTSWWLFVKSKQSKPPIATNMNWF